jgi:hypothetical protein
MDNTTIQKLKDAIAKSENIGVVVGKEPTLDQMAAALSLYLLLKDVRKMVTIAAPEDPIVEISSLVGIDKVQRVLGGESGDLVVSFPYLEEGEIEKVSYTIENGYLNIIVKAGEKGLSFDEKDVKFAKGSGQVDLLFVIGTSSLSEISEVIDSEKNRDAKIVNIDNKENNQGFGDIVIVSPEYSSVSEQIGDLGLTLGFHPDRDAAQNILNGIISATKNFQNPNTTPLAFEIVGEMMKIGAVRTRSVSDKTGYRPQASNEQRPQEQRFDTRRDQQMDDNRPAIEDKPQREEKPREHRGFKSREDKVREELQQKDQQQDDKTPSDWLSPKVYKGSSEV